MITGFASKASAIEAVNLGAYGYVQKPYELEQLLLTIQRAIEKREAEDALHVSEERYRTIFDQAADSIVLIDAETGGLVEFNERTHEHLGYTRKEFEKLRISDFEVIESPEEVAKHIEKVTKVGAHRFETKHRTKSGEIRDFEVSARAVSIHGKNFIQSIWRDITELKRSAEALRESEKRFRTFADFTYDWESWIGPDGKYIYVSPSCERITAYSPEDFLKSPRLLETIAHPDDRKKIFAHLNGHLADDELQRIDFRVITRSGDTRWVSHICQPVHDSNGDWLGRRTCNRDITEQRKLEEQLRQVQKMEAIGTLAGGIAHDFNNILSIVVGYTELAIDDASDGTSLHNRLQKVLEAGYRARDLVKQILTFSRQTELQLQPVQVKLIVKEALKLLRASLPTTIEIRQNIQSDSSVLADPTQIHQILMNLCTNAGHAMREKGGILEVSLSNVECGRRKAEVEADQEQPAMAHLDLTPGPYVKLTVSDTGHGIPAEVLGNIFDPFFTTKEIGEGTGLGLAVVHGIVKSHGGVLKVYSEPGKGTAFHVYLPVIKREVEPAGEIEKPFPTGNERVLFVDDEKLLADLGRQMLEPLGYEVTIRTSSIEALELFKARHDDFDIVVTDMTMPNMTGAKLAGKIMSIRPDIPIILCTGFSERITPERAKAMGIRAFIMKPLIRNKLIMTIRRVLDQKDFLLTNDN